MVAPRRWTLGVAAGGLVLAACGGAGQPTAGERETTPPGTPAVTASPSPAATEAATIPEAEATASPPVALPGEVNNHGAGQVSPAGRLSMEADDFYFEPTFVKTEPDQTIQVALHNEGTERHTFTIDGQGIDEVLSPGEEATVEVTAPDGAVRFYCRFHADQGMHGAFYTQPGVSITGQPGGQGGQTGDQGGTGPY